MSIWQQGLTNLGNWADIIGTKINLPEFGVSEALASGPTENTYIAPTSTSGGGGGGGTITDNWQAPTNNTAPSGGGDTGGGIVDTGGGDGGGNNGGNTGPSAEELARQQYESQVRGDINSGYDAYTASLNDQLNGLGGQVDTQNQIVDNQLSTGLGDLGLQYQQGQDQFGNQRGEVASNQKANNKSLDENLRNLFMAGNVYLGSRGAGDSSAANQYAYALTKEGNKARGDQMTQSAKSIAEIQGRETNLKNIFDTETTKLKKEADTKKLGVVQWFQDAQQQIKSAIASGQLNRSTDLANLSKSLLDQAMTRLQQVQTDATNKQNSLITWAENNSSTINQLKANMQQVMSIAPTLAAGTSVNGAINTDAQGNASMNPMIGSAGNMENKKDMWGNVIS